MESAYEFFRNLFSSLKLQGLKAPLEVLAIVGPEGPTPLPKFPPPCDDTTASSGTQARWFFRGADNVQPPTRVHRSCLI